MKFATKFMRHYPPHLKQIATLPWEIKNSNFPAFVNCCYCEKNFNVMVENDYTDKLVYMGRATGAVIIMTSIAFYVGNRRRLFAHPCY